MQIQMFKRKICRLKIYYNEQRREFSLVPNICQNSIFKIASELDSVLDAVLDAQVIGSTISTTSIKTDY